MLNRIRLMTGALSRLILCALVLTVFFYPAFAQQRQERMVGPGVKFYTSVNSDLPLAATILEVDLSNPHITLELGMSNEHLTGNERLSSISDRLNRPGHWVVGAINGDFWADAGLPIGMVVKSGQLLKTPINRSAFALTTAKRPLIDIFETDLSITGTRGNTLTFKDMNSSIKGDRPVLLTSLRKRGLITPVGCHTILLAPNIWELPPRERTSASVLRLASPGESVEISDTQVAFLTPAERLADIPEGFVLADEVILQVETVGRESGREQDLSLVIGGGPRLLKDGEVVVGEYPEALTDEAFKMTRHPRTAVGISQDEKTLYFVVVDGRQPGHSIGINLYDLAAFMKDLGAWQAVNMDGGGSSTMVVRGEIVNKPSDVDGERPISNGLLIVSTAPQGPIQHCRIEPTTFEVFPGEALQLSLDAQDQYYNPIEVPDDLVRWTVLDGPGEVDSSGLFRSSSRSGRVTLAATVEGVIGASMNAITTRSFGDVVQPSQIRLIPEQVAIGTGEQVTLLVEAQDPKGQWREIAPDLVHWRLRNRRMGTLSDEGVFTAGAAGRSTIEARLGSLRVEAPVVVGDKRTVLLDDFSNLEDWRLTGVNVSLNLCRILPGQDQVAAGTQSLRLDYDLRGHDGTSALYLNTLKSLPETPEKISFKLYGDGSGHLFRMVLKDVDGERFIADAPGTILWSDRWEEVEVPFSRFTPHWDNPGAKPDAPFHLEQFYLVEPNNENKKQGTLYLDDLQVVYPPSMN